MGDTQVDLYDTYAVFRCPSQYQALGLVQANYQLVEAKASKDGAKGEEEAAEGDAGGK